MKLLRHLGAKHAAQLVVCGDGARNIWDRVDGLLVKIEIDRSRVRLFADFWHAVEYITKAAVCVSTGSTPATEADVGKSTGCPGEYRHRLELVLRDYLNRSRERIAREIG